MKIILSRKGFDSEYGGVPSPILPNGRHLSLPIPDELGTKVFQDIGTSGAGLADTSVGQLVESLTNGRVRQDLIAHLDPDLDAHAIPRQPGWHPTFGQAQAAQGHLDNQGVGVGDVFLFYGWFREVGLEQGRWTFKKKTRGQHVLFGWLQVGEKIEVAPGTEPALLATHPWLSDHPHLHVPASMLRGRNVVYVASDRLSLPGYPALDLPGGGVLNRYCRELVLTAPESEKRSTWLLPEWFSSEGGRTALSYHGSERRWRRQGEMVELLSVAKGQEFVLDCDSRPAASAWLRTVIERGSGAESA